jgi:transposase-like protein
MKNEVLKAKCIYCGSENVEYIGTIDGIESWLCNDCHQYEARDTVDLTFRETQQF